MVRNRVQKMDHLYGRDIWFHGHMLLARCITVYCHHKNITFLAREHKQLDTNEHPYPDIQIYL